MVTQQTAHPTESGTAGDEDYSRPAVTDQCLLIRNYDGSTTHQVQVRFIDSSYETAFDRTITMTPLEAKTVEARLERGIYRVEAQLDNEATDSAQCLIGSGANELAVVETGNGIISVVDGHY